MIKKSNKFNSKINKKCKIIKKWKSNKLINKKNNINKMSKK